MDKLHGVMTYRLTQLFSEHRCFNRFFHGIGRAPTPGCSHFGFSDEENELDDDALHTLMCCEALGYLATGLRFRISRRLSCPPRKKLSSGVRRKKHE